MSTSFRVVKRAPADLLAAYKPDEIWGHCAQCGNHAKVWSCPPHSFDPVPLIERFAQVYVVAATISLTGFDTQAEAMVHYYGQRRRINRALLTFEATVPGAVGLYAGHCDACEPCTRPAERGCAHPGRCRYSLESLGLDVSGLMETFFDERLQWAAGEIPKQLLAVPALLSPTPIDQEQLIQTLKQGTTRSIS